MAAIQLAHAGECAAGCVRDRCPAELATTHPCFPFVPSPPDAGRKASTSELWKGREAPIPPTDELGWEPVAPSAVPFSGTTRPWQHAAPPCALATTALPACRPAPPPSPCCWPAEHNNMPRALDQAGVDQVVGDFRAAAERAVQAGFQVIELHFAHGYLVHEFLSPLANERWAGGGSLLTCRQPVLLCLLPALPATGCCGSTPRRAAGPRMRAALQER